MYWIYASMGFAAIQAQPAGLNASFQAEFAKNKM
jgi:hypothetical protein